MSDDNLLHNEVSGRKASNMLALVLTIAFVMVFLGVSASQIGFAGPLISPISTPAALMSPLPTPSAAGALTFVSPLLLENVTPRAYLPIVSNNYPLYLSYSKKGIGDPWQNWTLPNSGTNLSTLNFDWYYDWRFNYLPERNTDPRYVRMVWCLGVVDTDIYSITHTITDTAREDFNRNWRGRVWLIFNEPDGNGGCGGSTLINDRQVHSDAIGTAHHYGAVYDMIKSADPYAKVYGGGLVWLNYSETRLWWQSFVNTLQSEGTLYKLEGVHIHLYPGASTAITRTMTYANCLDPLCIEDSEQVANDWYSQMHEGLGLGDRPLWITEMGWLPCSEQTPFTWVRDNVMIPLSQWFTGQVALDHYDAVAWFVTRYTENNCSFLLDSLGPNGAPTPLGTQWNAYQP